MAIALTLQRYLESRDIRYDVIVHQPTMTARQTARTCEIPADHLAKAVLMRDGQGCVVAVLPASCQVQKAQLWRLLHRPVELASGTMPTDCSATAPVAPFRPSAKAASKRSSMIGSTGAESASKPAS
jgi:Ala-tRNA(Pro) deacylase